MINASPRMGHRAKNKMITAKEAIQTVRTFKLQLITAKLSGTRQRENQMVATLEYERLEKSQAFDQIDLWDFSPWDQRMFLVMQACGIKYWP